MTSSPGIQYFIRKVFKILEHLLYGLNVSRLFSVCKYKRTAWGLCDKITNTKVMVKTLKRGDPAHCEATETVERKCKGNTKTQATNRGEF